MTAPSPLTVVLVEDDDHDIMLIQRALNELAIVGRVVVEPESEHVIPYLCGDIPYRDRETYPFPDVLILDRKMPHLSGVDILFWIRTEPQFARLPVVALSGGFSLDESEVVRRLNAALCIKPLESCDFPRILEEGIGHALELAKLHGISNSTSGS